MNVDLKKGWYLGDKLTRIEREGLFILLESAGIVVHSLTRNHSSNEGVFPFLMFKEEDNWITATTRCEKNGDIPEKYQIVDYQSLVDTIKEAIKESNETERI